MNKGLLQRCCELKRHHKGFPVLDFEKLEQFAKSYASRIPALTSRKLEKQELANAVIFGAEYGADYIRDTILMEIEKQ